MWIVVSRVPRPDAAYWPGRRWLALVDALVWPISLGVLIFEVPFTTGVVGVVGILFATVIAARRSHRALLRNERYRFTTGRWVLALAGLSAIGAASRLLA